MLKMILREDDGDAGIEVVSIRVWWPFCCCWVWLFHTADLKHHVLLSPCYQPRFISHCLSCFLSHLHSCTRSIWCRDCHDVGNTCQLGQIDKVKIAQITGEKELPLLPPQILMKLLNTFALFMSALLFLILFEDFISCSFTVYIRVHSNSWIEGINSFW